jgi:hypothetical protein
LDRPVHFWRAGISLREVFAAIDEQTGVGLGFWPEGDENPRVRVNLYLNAHDPPTLREAMVQLAWVTDCAFACTSPEPGADRAYYLLATSLSGDPPSRMREAQQAQRAEIVEDDLLSGDHYRVTVRAKLRELAAALGMTRAEGISTYRNSDEGMLLTLLDPRRRAAAEFVCRAAEVEPRWYAIDRGWAELEDAERDLLRTAFGLAEDAEDDRILDISIHGHHMGYIELSLGVVTHKEGIGRCTVPIGEPLVLLDVRDDAGLEAEQVLALARLLGEGVPASEEAAHIAERERALLEARQERHREEALSGTAEARALSPNAAVLLSNLALGLEGRGQTLWQIQEAVGSTSGMNVVSDCFWQPVRYRDWDECGSALHVLAAYSLGDEGSRCDALPLEWEWGDAGPFLRFRSERRDLWRGALIPTAVLGGLDAVLETAVPEEIEGLRRDPTLEVEVDLDALVRIARSLDDAQLQYGCKMVYGNPADAQSASRHAVREAFLDVVGRQAAFFRLLESLNTDQWAAARGEGLRCGEDLDEAQYSKLNEMLALMGMPPWIVRTCVLKAEGSLLDGAAGSVEDCLLSARILEEAQAWAGGGVVMEFRIPSRVTARVHLRERAGEAAAAPAASG